MKHALINAETGQIIEVTTAEFPIAHPLAWIDVDDNVSPETHTYNTGTDTVHLISDGEAIADTYAQKLAELKQRRDLAITSGITYGGAEITTDELTQQRLIAARILAKEAIDNNQEYTIDWKAANGWVSLTAEHIINVADAVRAHVQNCFTTEKQHYEAITAYYNANDKDSVRNYNVETLWD